MKNTTSMMALLVLVGTVLIGVGLTSLSDGADRPSSGQEVAALPPMPDEALVQRGKEVYLENWCGSCHMLEDANSRGNFGPPHDSAALKAAEHLQLSTYNGEATTVEGYLRESIVNPSVFYTPSYEATNHHMPVFSHLPEADIDALVALMVAQRDLIEAEVASGG